MKTKEILRGILLCAAMLGTAVATDVYAAGHATAKDAAHAATASARGSNAHHAPAKSGAININTADAQSLADGLQGIGMSKAQLIVAHRKEHGPFTTADELGDVKGIGKKTLEKNRARITLK